MASTSGHRPLNDIELEQLLLEPSDIENDNLSFGGEDTDNDSDYVEIQSDSESEQSGNDEADDRPASPKTKRLSILRGKCGYKWSSDVPQKRGRRQARNLVTHLPGVRGAAKEVTKPLEAWLVLFSNNILDIVLR